MKPKDYNAETISSVQGTEEPSPQKKKIQKEFCDRDICMDALFSQRLAAYEYNYSLQRSVTTPIRNEFTDILIHEYSIADEILKEATKRGWYNEEKALKEQIDRIKQAFSSN